MYVFMHIHYNPASNYNLQIKKKIVKAQNKTKILSNSVGVSCGSTKSHHIVLFMYVAITTNRLLYDAKLIYIGESKN